MSDNRPNDGNTTPDTDAPDATPSETSDPITPAPSYREPEPVDYDAAAAAEATDRANSEDLTTAEAEPSGFTGTGSHAAVPARSTETPSSLQDDYTATDAGASAPAAAEVPTDYTPQYTPAPPPTQTPIYVQAPTAPRYRGNRGGGIAIALLATVVYAALYALVAFIIAGVSSATMADAVSTFTEFAVRPVFYVPIVFFFIAFALLIALVNRAGWWAYVLFGFLVGAVVYFSYIGGALLTVQAWTLTPADAARFVSSQWLNPGAIAAGLIAREVPIWAGAWIARRGRRVTARNADSRREYERLLAEGPQLSR